MQINLRIIDKIDVSIITLYFLTVFVYITNSIFIYNIIITQQSLHFYNIIFFHLYIYTILNYLISIISTKMFFMLNKSIFQSLI